MGLMGRILGAGTAVSQVGEAVGGVAEVFVGNRAEREAADANQLLAALAQYGLEFQQPATGWFDRFMNGLNRVPRPLLVVGTLGLFTYAMVAPTGFALRMEGLALVPEPLWWLFGAIVSFYFGARELHYQRGKGAIVPRVASLAADTGAFAETTDPAETRDAQPVALLSLGAARTTAVTATRPRPRPAAKAAVTVNAADPRFNAAIEEWRAVRG